ncbi:universal stress protein [Massilia sp. BSC265]|uniref:universal stress protein n=1 Tax=Massilia sp. BSC265 TaxID=1549812 RepID=UPI0006920E7C|nr:universal stress protein [Massilia sp. BSC265]
MDPRTRYGQLRHAVAYVRRSGPARVDLVHVLDPHRHRAKASVLSSDELARLAPDDFQRATDAARQILDAAAIPYRLHCRAGDPASEIAAQARESGCDMVIMGTRGLGLMGNLVIGSVASRVVCYVDVPVTLIK